MDINTIVNLVIGKMERLMIVFFVLQIVVVVSVYLLFAYHAAGFENDLLWRLGMPTAPNVMCYPQFVH